MPDNNKKHEENLFVKVFNDSSTRKIMNQFEGLDGNDTFYDRLILINQIPILLSNNSYCWLNLIIERRPNDIQTEGDITFTQLKQSKPEYYIFRNFVEKDIEENINLISKYLDKNIIYRFSKPYYFRAQNALDYSYYGWDGCEYGETSDYMIIGAIINSDYSSSFPIEQDDIYFEEKLKQSELKYIEIYISNNPKVCSSCGSECKYQYINYTKADGALHKVNVAICLNCGRKHILTGFYNSFIRGNKDSNLTFIDVNAINDSDEETDQNEIGEDNDSDNQEIPNESDDLFELTPEDKYLLSKYRNLSAHDKEIVDFIMEMKE